jgi:hypothetical protein
VTGVYFSSTAWQPSFLTTLAGLTMGGSMGYEVLSAGSTQLASLPWVNLNQVSITFNEDVSSIVQGDLLIVGVNQSSYTTTGFSYTKNDATKTYVATWSLGSSLVDDKLIVSLSGAAVTDSAGSELDGTWVTGVSNYPSGAATPAPGTDFNFRVNVLPGDVSRNGVTTVADISLVRAAGGKSGQAFPDLNGSGAVTIADVSLAEVNGGKSVPAADPTNPVHPAVITAGAVVAAAASTPTVAAAASTTQPAGKPALAVVLTPVPAPAPAAAPVAAPKTFAAPISPAQPQPAVRAEFEVPAKSPVTPLPWSNVTAPTTPALENSWPWQPDWSVAPNRDPNNPDVNLLLRMETPLPI